MGRCFIFGEERVLVFYFNLTSQIRALTCFSRVLLKQSDGFPILISLVVLLYYYSHLRFALERKRSRQIIRYRATIILRRPQIKQYTASDEG